MEKQLAIKTIILDGDGDEDDRTVIIRLVKKVKLNIIEVEYKITIEDDISADKTATCDNYKEAKKTFDRWVDQAEEMAYKFNKVENTEDEE